MQPDSRRPGAGDRPFPSGVVYIRPVEGVEVTDEELHHAEPAGEIIEAEYEEFPALRQAPRPRRPVIRTAPRWPKSRGLQRLLTGPAAREAAAPWVGAAGPWDDSAANGPTPRHRRRLILKWTAGLRYDDCLDAACASPADAALLHALVRQGRSTGRLVAGFGCAAPGAGSAGRNSAASRASAARPDPLGCQFLRLDLSREVWPDARQFDLVVCPEILAQTKSWRLALSNLVGMSRRYLLVTAPALGPGESDAGRRRHFNELELAGALVGHGMTLLRQRRWGFPVQSICRAALPASLTAGAPDAGASLPMRLVAKGIYLAFFSNDLFQGGAQHILLAEKR